MIGQHRSLQFVVFFFAISVPANAADASDCKFSLSHEVVKSMDLNKLKAHIKSALEYRIAQCRNISYEVETRCGLCKFDEQVPHDFTQLFTSEHIKCWAIGNSFLIENERRDRQSGIVTYIRKDAFDAKEGVMRYYGMEHPSGDNKFGALDSEVTRAPFSSHTYIYWLDMPDQYEYVGERFLGKCVSNYDNWQIRVLPDAFVELQCNWKLPLNKDVVGKVSYVLDPLKGFLPSSCNGLWKDAKGANYFKQYEVRFIVDESKLVNEVWMPTKLRDAICPNGEKAKGNLFITKVNRVEIGRTTESDLQLSFPPGTEVQDRLKGVVFTAGANDERKDIKRLGR